MEQEQLTVLVVDDELPLRQELRLFPWEAHGFKLVGEAENGEDALRFCRSFSPDLVITDITMPIMDGLGLFRALKEQMPHILVVLLTCHSDFSFAREAIQLGAVEYLVKVTMEERDLEQALLKAREAYDRDRSIRKNETERRRWARSKELARLVRQTGESREAPSLHGEIVRFLRDTFNLTLPAYLTAIHVEAKTENRLHVKREVEENLTRLERWGEPFTWLPAADGIYLLWFEQKAQQAPVLSAKLEGVTAELYGAIDRELPFLRDTVRIYAVISGLVAHPAEFTALYRSALTQPVLRFYDAACRVFIGDRQASGPDERAVREMTEELQRTKWDRMRLLEWLRLELPKWASKHRMEPDALKALVTDWRREWLSGSGAFAKLDGTVRAVAASDTVQELVAALVHEVEAGGSAKMLRKEIADAKSFIDAHLDRTVTLAAVAHAVGLSPHYISRLFREETGVSFNDYITRKRMEKAVQLLQTTSMRVYEVAGAVGIPNYRYFTAMFREWIGMAPTDIRKASGIRHEDVKG